MSNARKKSEILVVDDEASVRDVVSCALIQAGYKVTTASDGRQALSLTAKRAFDLMFLDIRMPGLSGLDVLKLMKVSRPGMPVVMLTGMTDESHRNETLKYEAFEYLTKPCSIAEVIALADRLIAHQETAKTPLAATLNDQSFENECERILSADTCDTMRTPPPSPSSLSILVVDDEDSVRDVLAQALQGEGYDVDTASNGMAALDTVSRKHYSLMFLDVRMPGMSGLEVLAQITEKYPSIVVVMLSAVTGQDSQMIANQHEAFAYLTKPCSLTEVIDVAITVLQQRALAED